jgi:cytochrome oxidase Cu insertion factor (SCO1/SenC/PrrC family)
MVSAIAGNPARGYSSVSALPAHARRSLTLEPKTGSAAPDFTLPSHTDQKVSLASFKGKPVVVAFMPFAFTGG